MSLIPPPPPRWPGLTARIGQALLAPRPAALRLCHGGPGGVSDAAVLLGLRLLGQNLQVLARGVLHVDEEGMGSLWAALEQSLRAAREDLVLILAGGVLLSLLTGPGERLLRPGLGVELAAQAWLGWLAAQLLGTVVVGLWPRLGVVVQAVGLGLFALLWGLALREARAAARAAAGDINRRDNHR